MLLASGLSMIYGLMDVVNFAHGAFYMLGSYAMYSLGLFSSHFGINVALSVLAVAAIGALTEMTLLRPLYKRNNPLYPLLLTFGLSLAIPDIIKIFFGLVGKPIPYPEIFMGSWMFGPVIVPKYRMLVIAVTFTVLIGLWLFLKKSNLGMILRAATTDQRMVDVLGDQRQARHDPRFHHRHCPGRPGRQHGRTHGGRGTGHGRQHDHAEFCRHGHRRPWAVWAAPLWAASSSGRWSVFTSLFAGAYADVAIYFAMAVILLVRPRGTVRGNRARVTNNEVNMNDSITPKNFFEEYKYILLAFILILLMPVLIPIPTATEILIYGLFANGVQHRPGIHGHALLRPRRIFRHWAPTAPGSP